MSKSICSKNHFDSKVINVFFEGLDFTPICKRCAIGFLKKNMSCKRYAKRNTLHNVHQQLVAFYRKKRVIYHVVQIVLKMIIRLLLKH